LTDFESDGSRNVEARVITKQGIHFTHYPYKMPNCVQKPDKMTFLHKQTDNGNIIGDTVKSPKFQPSINFLEWQHDNILKSGNKTANIMLKL